jgi:hypothetical protein
MAVGSSGVSNFVYTSSGQALHVEALQSNGPYVSIGYIPSTAILTEAGDPLMTEDGNFLLTE